MKKRIQYYDYLRVIATIAVIILHVAAQNWNQFSGRSIAWNAVNLYNGFARWSVPMFVMISGGLFLSKEIDNKTLYKKYVLKLAVAFVVWSVFYAVAVPLVEAVSSGNVKVSYKEIFTNIIQGEHHMWFIPMIIGLYMCVPILKEIVKSKTTATYFLLLSFVFTFLFRQLADLSNDFVGGMFASGMNEIYDMVHNKMSMHLVFGFPFYYVLGYWLKNTELTKKQRGMIYILGAVGFLSTVVLNAAVAWKTNKPCSTYYDNFSINVLWEVLAVYTWFQYKAYHNEKLNKFVSALAKYSFGAYFVHVFVMCVLQAVGIHNLMCTPIVSVPAVSLITIIISFLISWVIHKIPVIRKWIV